MTNFDSIKKAIDEIKKGRIIIVVDDEDRENEGDFIMAAEMITPEAVKETMVKTQKMIKIRLKW